MELAFYSDSWYLYKTLELQTARFKNLKWITAITLYIEHLWRSANWQNKKYSGTAHQNIDSYLMSLCDAEFIKKCFLLLFWMALELFWIFDIVSSINSRLYVMFIYILNIKSVYIFCLNKEHFVPSKLPLLMAFLLRSSGTLTMSAVYKTINKEFDGNSFIPNF